MLTKDIISQDLGIEFVVVDPNAYVHKNSRNIRDIKESQALVVKLANKSTYGESNHTWTDANHPTFRPTNTEKVKHFLVYYSNGTEDVYRTIKAQDFLGLHSEAKTVWADARVKEEAQRVLREKEEAILSSLYDQANATAEGLKVAVAENAIAMFGNVVGQSIGAPYISAHPRVTQNPDGTLKGRIEVSGDVRIPVEEFLRLAERWANLQDA